MGGAFNQFTEIASWLFLIYGSIISCGYLFTAIFSLIEIRDYKRRNNFEDDIALLQSLNLPAISILAPAFNEGLNIVENVRSLLTINYPSFEIVIINDGSSDNSMQLLIDAYELEKRDILFHDFIPSKKIKGIYKSKNRAFRSLTLIDKENGGKADALNTGINICQNSVICCIDVDCILENDAMLKLIKPFLNNGNKVIASGGVIRVANSCIIEDGRLIEVKLPKSFVARVQVLEYFRAF